jgi:hypothetical protein
MVRIVTTERKRRGGRSEEVIRIQVNFERRELVSIIVRETGSSGW